MSLKVSQNYQGDEWNKLMYGNLWYFKRQVFDQDYNTNPLRLSVQIYGWKPLNIAHSARAKRVPIRHLALAEWQLPKGLWPV